MPELLKPEFTAAARKPNKEFQNFDDGGQRVDKIIVKAEPRVGVCQARIGGLGGKEQGAHALGGARRGKIVVPQPIITSAQRVGQPLVKFVARHVLPRANSRSEEHTSELQSLTN